MEKREVNSIYERQEETLVVGLKGDEGKSPESVEKNLEEGKCDKL